MYIEPNYLKVCVCCSCFNISTTKYTFVDSDSGVGEKWGSLEVNFLSFVFKFFLLISLIMFSRGQIPRSSFKGGDDSKKKIVGYIV